VSESDSVAVPAGPGEIIGHAGRRSGLSRALERGAEFVVVIALVGELVAMFGNVVLRAAFNSSLLWSLEVSELALVVMTFIGGAIAYPRDQHISLQVVIQRVPPAWRPALDALACWQVFAVALLGGRLFWQMMLSRWDQQTPYLGLGEIWFAIPMIAGMALLAFFSLERAFRQSARVALGSGLVLAAVVAVVVAIWWTIGLQLRDHAVGITFLVFIVQCLLGVPIGFALLLGSATYLAVSQTVPLSVIPTNMQNGISSFVMLAIPFFILAGYLMTEGGLSRRLMDFIIMLVSRFRGGMMQVIVVTMYIMSGISGSKLADVAAVANTMNRVMAGEGYELSETAAVLSACAVMGETVPPSIAMLVLASVTTLSIGAMFVAGLLPAAVMAACLMALIWFRSRGRKGSAQRYSPVEKLRAGLIALPALVAPVILVGGIVTGIATPTEVSSTAVVYALVLSVIFYRSLGLRQFLRVVSHTASQAGMVLFITATATAFSWSLTIARMPQRIVELFGMLHGSGSLFMLATIVTLVAMGALLEGLPALLIFGPLLLPVTAAFGIPPLQYGIVLVIAMGFGAFSPPIGVGFFVTCAICGTTAEEVTRHMLPYLVILAIGLLLVAFVPWFSLVLPQLLHMA